MKKLGSIFLILFLCLLLSQQAKAESISVTLDSEKESVITGEMFQIKMKLSSGESFKKMEGYLIYDEKFVRYISSDDGILGGSGKLKINMENLLPDGYVEEYEEDYGVLEENPEAEAEKKIFTMVFKALKPGRAVFSFLDGLKVVSAQDEEMSISQKTMEIIVKEPREESNVSSLSEIRIEGAEILPKFSKNIFNYTVRVPNEVEKLNITAIPTDEKSGIVIAGNQDFKIGENLVKLIVTAEGGEKSAYEVIVTREEKKSVMEEKPASSTPQKDGIEGVEKKEEKEALSVNENKESGKKNSKKILFYGIMGGVGFITFIILKILLKFLDKIEEKEEKK